MLGGIRAKFALMVLCCAAATFASPSAVEAADPPIASSGVLDIAHRGASGHAPEHTLAATDLAVAEGADRLSIDIHLTADGVPIVLHDDSLARTTDVEQRFPDAPSFRADAFTLAQIKTLDAGSWYGTGVFAGSTVLTLDELMTELDGTQTGLTVEAKDPEDQGGADGIGQAIMKVVDAHPGGGQASASGVPRLVLEAFPDADAGWAFLDAMHDAYPSLPLVLLGRVTPQDLDDRPFVKEIDVPEDWVSADLVAAAGQRGVRVGTWTVNETSDIQRVVGDGVGAVTGDLPDRTRDILAAAHLTYVRGAAPLIAPVAHVNVETPPTATLDGRMRVLVKPLGQAGQPLPWRVVDLQTQTAGAWVDVARTATDSHGTALASLPVTDGVEVRARVEGHLSAVNRPVVGTTPVTLPPGAPGPSYAVALQSRTTTPGADPQVTTLSNAVWNEMKGRTWRAGCPVGRSGLRKLTVSYWGFDGYRHRGALVVAGSSAKRLGSVFTALYRQRVPLRSLRRIETVGTWGATVGNSLRADASFAFACQPTPGDSGSIGSHARGRVVSINPWENPTALKTGASPNSWWLPRTPAATYVASPGSPLVQAFAAEGFQWNGATGRNAEFRDVR